MRKEERALRVTYRKSFFVGIFVILTLFCFAQDLLRAETGENPESLKIINCVEARSVETPWTSSWHPNLTLRVSLDALWTNSYSPTAKPEELCSSDQLDLALVDSFHLTRVGDQTLRNSSSDFGPQRPSLESIGKSKSSDSIFTTTLLMNAALNTADYVLTRESLRYAGVAEGNPMMKNIAKDPYVFAAVKVGVSALNFYLMKNLYKKNRTLAWVLTTVTNFAMTYVVGHNIRVLSDAKNITSFARRPSGEFLFTHGQARGTLPFGSVKSCPCLFLSSGQDR
jgi:hypothetical protein